MPSDIRHDISEIRAYININSDARYSKVLRCLENKTYKKCDFDMLFRFLSRHCKELFLFAFENADKKILPNDIYNIALRTEDPSIMEVVRNRGYYGTRARPNISSFIGLSDMSIQLFIVNNIAAGDIESPLYMSIYREMDTEIRYILDQCSARKTELYLLFIYACLVLQRFKLMERIRTRDLDTYIDYNDIYKDFVLNSNTVTDVANVYSVKLDTVAILTYLLENRMVSLPRPISELYSTTDEELIAYIIEYYYEPDFVQTILSKNAVLCAAIFARFEVSTYVYNYQDVIDAANATRDHIFIDMAYMYMPDKYKKAKAKK